MIDDSRTIVRGSGSGGAGAAVGLSQLICAGRRGCRSFVGVPGGWLGRWLGEGAGWDGARVRGIHGRGSAGWLGDGLRIERLQHAWSTVHGRFGRTRHGVQYRIFGWSERYMDSCKHPKQESMNKGTARGYGTQSSGLTVINHRERHGAGPTAAGVIPSTGGRGCCWENRTAGRPRRRTRPTRCRRSSPGWPGSTARPSVRRVRRGGPASGRPAPSGRVG